MKETIGKILIVGFIVAGLSYGCHQDTEYKKAILEKEFQLELNSLAEKGSPCDCSKSKTP